ncbi:MAG: MotA/TolQ/ExbB proton channel family protein [Candidatus Omnitrophica bacterium]|nr:MotA/TolQ/ExbB proton channel family protein [Candidatus Omnitrophota bacterium]
MVVSFISVWGILLKGGPMMWPIFLLSILAITVGIEKFLFLSAIEQNTKKFKPVFFKALRENRMKDALGICEENALGLGAICKAGLMKFGSSADLIKSSMEQAAGFEIHVLKKRLNLLGFIVNAAPMLGLLGTTTSLCVVFHAVQMRSNALNPLSLGDMASGIWQALVTTSAGLFVGIVSFAIYSFTASRVNDVLAAFEQTISESVRILQAVSELDRQGGALES